jgi:ABC-type antimicrobial peptide transport system permease subunit
MGISFVGGRDFEPGEFDPSGPRTIVVNETFVRTLFNGENPIGKTHEEDRIIGVVRDSKYTSLKGETQPTVYKPFLKARTGRGQMILHVRTMIDPDAIAGRVREEVWKADRTAPQFAVHTLAEEVDGVLVRERLLATVSSMLGSLALILASIGLYGVLAFAVAQRTPEMGLRVALGAQRRDMMAMILKEGLAVVLVGIAIGIPAALVLTRVAGSQISGLLFGLKPGDPITIGMAAGLLILIAAIAGYGPARRASRVDPVVALRNE